MASSSALDLGRSAVAARRWGAGCDNLTQAQADAGGHLSAPDLELLAAASFLRGHPQQSFDALSGANEAYLAEEDVLGAARTAGWQAIELLEVGEITPSGTWVARGLRLIEQLDDSTSVGGLVALVPAALTAMFVGDVAEAIRRFDEIAAIADRTGDRELAAHAAFGRGKSLTTIGETAGGFVSLDEALAAATEGHVSAVSVCIFYRVALDVCHEAFDLDRAERWTTAFVRWCAEQPELVAYSGQSHAYRAQLALLHGDWADASSAAHLAEERLRAGDFTAAYVANYQLAELHRLRGEFGTADVHYRRAAQTGWDPQPGLALLELARNQVELAQTSIRRAAAGVDEGTRRRLLPAVVEIEVAAGDVTAARRAADELLELDRTWRRPLLVAHAAFADAQVLLAEGDPAAALRSADAAITAWQRLRMPYEAARSRVLKGRILNALGQTAAAVASFDAALAAFADLGAGPAMNDVLKLTGRHAAGTLTEREVEVLRLVSTGLTNRAIAGRLSLSEKTVARHLSNIFGKLGLSTRAAATAYAYEHGIV